jgi:hypothetical protein
MKPIGNKIQLEIEELKFGAIQSDAISECGKIIDYGVGAINLLERNWNVEAGNSLIGKTLYFKAWAVDIITDPEDGKKYYFISADSDAICAIK